MLSFLSALPRRQLYLGGIALLLAVILIARWIANWGLVTIHAKEQPLAKVIASIARQGGVRIESSLDPSKRVTMDVVKVTPVEALEILAEATESGWRVVYLAAPTKTALNEAIVSLSGTGKIEGWTTSYYPGPGGAGGAEYGQVIDARFLAISMEGPDPDLAKLLDETAQKSGVMTALPKDWTPAAKLPKSATVRKAVSSLVGSAHGKVAEFFFLNERRRHEWGGAGPGEGDEEADGASGLRPSGSPGQQPGVTGNGGSRVPWGERADVNPAWMEQRQLAQIKKLPSDKQTQALKDREERKAFFDSLKGLTPQERMAKIQDMMANSEMGQKMQDSRLLQEAKQSAERRITRAVSYLNRKAAAKASQ
ncbi:MAG: hypothetical protein WCR44_05475 [Verrucomicrobiota bacterium]